MMHFRSMIVAASALVAACTQAEWSSINRPFNPTHGDARLIDAKQRAIVAVKRPVFIDDKGNVKLTGRWKDKVLTTPVVCAEPSPDALQATAAALSGSGDSEKIATTLSLAFSNSEAATSIGLRTQSIQLLRDAYYRLCEAYLNDGIDSISYDVLQRRFQNQVIALLAVEQLTGVTRAAQNSVTTQSSSDAGANAGKLANQLDEGRKQLTSLKGEGAAIAAEIAELEKPITIPATPPADKAAAEKKEEERKVSLEKKKAEQAENSAAQDDQVKLIASLDDAYKEALKQTTKASASGSAIPGTATSGGANITNDVANAVRAITVNAINQDYETQVCFETLRGRNHNNLQKNKTGVQEKFLTYCENLLQQEVFLKSAQVGALNARNRNLDEIVNAATGRSGKRLPAKDAVNLILAYDRATPLRPETRFLAETLEFTGEKTGAATPAIAPAKAPSGGTKTSTKATTKDVSKDDLTKLREEILGEIQNLGAARPAAGGATSQQEVVTRLKSVTTTTVEGQEVRPVCPANSSYDDGSKACLCAEGFAKQGDACTKPSADAQQ